MGGRNLSLLEAGELRNDVSTDEITPLASLVYFDGRLGRYPYTGVKCGDRLPIGVDAVRNGGFGVTVAGNRYGKGSSRVHSPAAELRAGIRLVIAKSFERIYRQNADNLGLFTSTDFGLVARVQAGEAIPIDELVAGREALSATVLKAGGLLLYGQQFLRISPLSPRGRGGRQTPYATWRINPPPPLPNPPPRGGRGLGHSPKKSSLVTSSPLPTQELISLRATASSCVPICVSFTTSTPRCARIRCTKPSVAR